MQLLETRWCFIVQQLVLRRQQLTGSSMACPLEVTCMSVISSCLHQWVVALVGCCRRTQIKKWTDEWLTAMILGFTHNYPINLYPRGDVHYDVMKSSQFKINLHGNIFSSEANYCIGERFCRHAHAKKTLQGSTLSVWHHIVHEIFWPVLVTRSTRPHLHVTQISFVNVRLRLIRSLEHSSL